MEFGRLATKSEEMVYALLLEQRKTNALLEKLLQQMVGPASKTVPKTGNVTIKQSKG